jgi:signal transduction histidine kinase
MRTRWRTTWARLGMDIPTRRDAVAASGLAVLGLSRLLLAVGVDTAGEPDAVLKLVGANVAATVDIATIAIRRRTPRVALALATAVVLVSTALPARYINTGIGVVVCAYTVAVVLPRRQAVITLTACGAVHAIGGIVAVALGGEVRELLTFWGNDGSDAVDLVLATLGTFGISGLVGSYVQTRRAYTAELLARSERLEREREERARMAVIEERGRIARELHDVAAHDLSAIVVQAGAADRLVDGDPEAAKATLRAIRAQGRDTMSALRQLVGIMRDSESDTADRFPQPTLRRLDDLLASARDVGMAIEVTTTGDAKALPPAVDLTGYRVVQEALTNARRHAPGAVVTVAITYGADALNIAVENRTDPAQRITGDGHGLVGMRERVRQVGGTLLVGADARSRWRVEARMPYHMPEDQ